MLAMERRRLILDQLQEEKSVEVSRLSKKFEVSEETIRRDLEKFERDGLVTKSYGGATLRENVGVEFPFAVRKKKNAAGKQAIGEILADLITDGDHILLDPSTTALSIVRALRTAGKKDITIVTNSIEVLVECGEDDSWHVISTGGILQPDKYALVGPRAVQGICSIHADKAIISCKGFDRERGLTDINDMFAQVKQTMLSHARRRILAVDSTKFDQIGFSRICGVEDVDLIVTDAKPPQPWEDYLREMERSCLYRDGDAYEKL